MEKSRLILVDSQALPEVFHKVLEAKEYLKSGTAASTSEAVRMAGISRSAFYKYKDAVYPYQDKGPKQLITVQAVLTDRPGVLMALISAFYGVGANILTVNQSIPVMGVALVSISARVENMNRSTDELLASLRNIEGVRTIEHIAGE